MVVARGGRLTLKLLDFGLAKTVGGAEAASLPAITPALLKDRLARAGYLAGF